MPLVDKLRPSDEPEPTTEAMIAVAQFPSPTAAHAAAAELEGKGISAGVSSEFILNLRTFGFTVYVAESDRDRSRQVLDDFDVPKDEPLKPRHRMSERLKRARRITHHRLARRPSVKPVGRPSGALHAIGFMAMCVAAGLIYEATKIPDKSFMDMAEIAVISAVIGTFGAYLQYRHKIDVQRHRDFEADQILIAPSERQFALFLRPFVITNRLELENAEHATTPVIPNFHKPRTIDFEELLQEALGNEVRLIGLGLPGEAIGAGRAAVSEADWRQHVEDLITRAQEIFVIPGDRPGILEELRLIRDRDALSKTIFLMPPKPQDAAVAGYFKSSWERAIAAVVVSAWELPAYRDSGMAFSLDDAGKLLASCDFSSGLGRSLETIRNARQKSPGEVAWAVPYWTPTRIALGMLVVVGAAVLLTLLVTWAADGPRTASRPDESQRVTLPLEPLEPPDWTSDYSVLRIDDVRIPVPSTFAPDEVARTTQFDADSPPDVVLGNGSNRGIAIKRVGVATDFVASRQEAVAMYAAGEVISKQLMGFALNLRPEPALFNDQDAQWSWAMSGSVGNGVRQLPFNRTETCVVIGDYLIRVDIEQVGGGDGSELKAFTRSFIEKMQFENSDSAQARGH